MRKPGVIFLLIFCLLSVFEDSVFTRFGGVFSANAAFVMVPVLVGAWLIFDRRIFKYEAVVIFCVFLYVLLSLLMLAFISGYDLRFLFDRGLRLMLVSFMPIFLVLYFARYSLSELVAVLPSVALLIAFSYVLNVLSPEFMAGTGMVHYTPALSPDRMRGFTLEASHFGFQFSCVFLLMARVYKKYALMILSLLFLMVLYSSSKGALVGLLVAGFSACLIFFKVPIATYVLSVLGFSFFGYFFLGDFLYSVFSSDIEQYTSVATRLAVMFTSLISVIYHPLGSGYFGFMPAIYEYGPYAASFMDSIGLGYLNLAEFYLYLQAGVAEGVSTKSFFFDMLVFYGVPFFVLFFYGAYRIFIPMFLARDILLVMFFVYFFVAIFSYVTVESKYLAAYCFVLLVKLSRESGLSDFQGSVK